MMEPSRMLQKLLADHDDDLPGAAEGLRLLADETAVGQIYAIGDPALQRG